MRRLILFLTLLPGLAAAQPMMDPRQASGIPRPDPAVGAGEMTVRVVLGELAKNAPAGTPVQLVALAQDGSAKLTTAKVNGEGRAEFKGLATDGQTAYYALAIVGGDRLVSQAAVLPPRIGIRMMLAAHKDGSPAVDDEQKGHEGVASAPNLPPAGEVEILARGRVAAGATVVVRELSEGTAREAKLQGSAGDVSAKLSDLAGGPDKVYVAEVTADGATHRSTPFMLAEKAGARRMILIYDSLLVALQGGAVLDDDALAFDLSLTVANMSGAPVNPGKDGLILPLPLGFSGVQEDEETSKLFTVEDGVGLKYRGTVPPGQVMATVHFSLPSKAGRVSVDMPAPLGMLQSQFAVEKAGSITVSSAPGELEAPTVRRADDGREYWVLEGFNISPGASLKFEIAGLPMADSWQRWVRILAAFLVVALVATAVAIAVRPRHPVVTTPARSPGASAESVRRELGARRERLYAELVALERARLHQRVDAGAFEAQRKAIMTKLVLVHRELDDLDGTGAPRSA